MALVANWQLNEGSGLVAVDKTGNHNGTYQEASTGFVSDIATAPVLPLTNDNVSFSVTGAGTADADGRVSFTTTNGGIVIVDQVSGAYTYTPAPNFHGADTFQLVTSGGGVTDTETITVTVDAVATDSVDVSGSVLTLDGANDKVIVQDNTSLNFGTDGSFTLESWVKTTDTGAFQRILIKPVGGGQSYSLAINDGKAHVRFDGSNSEGGQQTESTETVNDGSWHHIAGVFDNSGNTLSVYIDGELAGQTTGVTALPIQGTEDLVMGTLSSGLASQTLGGELDEIRIWNSARTAAEIRDNYDQQLTGSETNLQAYYRFDDSAVSTEVIDQTANRNDGTLENGARTTAVTGQALSFDGNDQVGLGTIDGTGLALGNSLSYEAWIKTSSTTGTYQVVSLGNTTSGQGTFFSVANSKLAFSATGNSAITSTTTVADGAWHHVAVTIDSAGNATLFVDGETDGTGTGYNLNISTGTGFVGQNITSDAGFVGEIADVRIWKDDRTADEIKANYQNVLTGDETDLAAYYTFDEPSTTVTSDHSDNNNNGTITGATKVVSTAPIEGPVVLGNEIETVVGIPTSGIMVANDVAGTITFSTTFSDAAKGTVAIDSDTGEWTYTPASGFSGNFTFDLRATGSLGSPAFEDETISVTVGDLDLVNVHSSVAQFDGTNDTLSAAIGNGTITNQITMEMWVNFQDLTGQQNVLAVWDTGTDLNRIVLEKRTSDTFSFFIGDGSTSATVDTGVAVVADTWYHVAVTYDGSTVATYVDGQHAVSQSVSGFTFDNVPQRIDVGHDDYNFHSNVLVDEVRVWKSVRTADEIKSNFDKQITTPSSETNLVGYLRFDDETDTSSDILASAPQLDGVDDFIDVGTVAGVSGAYTVEAWVKLDTYSATAQGFGRIVDFGQGEADDNILLILQGNTGKISLGNFVGNAVTQIITDAQITLDQWVHVAAVNNGNGTGAIYFDGVLQGVTGNTSNLGVAATVDRDSSFIGRSNWAVDDYLDGAVQEVRIWNSARTQDQINENMSNPIDNPDSVSDLKGYWHFDSTTNLGTAGNNNGGVTINGAEVVDAPDTALTFDGVDDVVTITDNANLNSPSGFGTWSVWVKTDGSWATGSGGVAALLNKSNGEPTSQDGVTLSASTTGTLAVQVKPANSGQDTISVDSTSITDNSWHQVTVSFGKAAGSFIKLYLDGELIGTATVSTAWDFAAQSFRIGDAVDDFWEEFKGQIADVAIFDRQLTDAEVASSYQQTPAPNASGLVGLYQFDEGSGTSATNNATSSNSTPEGIISGATYVDNAPDVFGTTLQVNEGVTVTGFFESNSTTYTVVSGSATVANGQVSAATSQGGTITVDQTTGQYTYVPPSKFYSASTSNVDTFTLKTTDLDGNEHTETVSVTVNRVDEASVDVAGGFLSLDGVDDTVVIPNSDSLNFGTGGSFTLESWVRTTDTGAFQRILVKTAGSTQQSYSLAINDGKAHVRFDGSNSEGGQQAESHQTINDGAWHHVAGVFDNTANTLSVYVDGNLAGQTTGVTALPIQGTSSLEIGAFPGQSSQHLAGELDDIRIWNNARTAEEIRDNYDQQLSGSESWLAAYYRFDDTNADTMIRDQTSNNNDGARTVGGEIISGLGNVLNLSAAGDHVVLHNGTDIGDLATGNGAFTYEVWINANATGNRMDILSIGDRDSNKSLFLHTEPTNGRLMFDNFTTKSVTGTTVVQDGSWHHVAASYDGSGTIKLYVDGVLDSTHTGFSMNISGTLAYIGENNSGSSGSFIGSLGEVRVWNDVRSAQEISENYVSPLSDTSGLIRHYDFAEADTGNVVNDVAGTNATGSLAGNAAIVSSTATILGQSIDVTHGDSFAGVMTASDVTGNGEFFVLNGSGTQQSTFTTGNGGVVTIEQDTGVWSYKASETYEGADTFTLRASDGTRNDDEVITVTVRDDDLMNVHGGVGQFDGVNDHVTVTHNAALNNANWTVESWFQTSSHTASGSANIGRLVSKEQATGGNQYSLYMSEGKISVATNTISTTTITSSSTYNDGGWHHAAGVYDGSTLKLYIDGELIQSANVTGTPTLDTNNLEIGSYDGTSQFFDGQIDEVRVWNDARTASEIKDNYKQVVESPASDSSLVAYYTFDDQSETGKVQNLSTNGDTLDGSLVNGAGIVNTLGQAMDFDGNDTVSVAGIDLNDQSFSWEFWTQRTSASGGADIILGALPGSGLATNNFLHAGYTTSTNFRFSFNSTGNNNELNYTDTGGIGEWAHWAGTFNKDTLLAKLFRNGELVSTENFAQVLNTTAPLLIGGSSSGQNYTGKVDELRLWDDLRTDQEIADNYNQRIDTTGNDLIPNYHFDEASGTVVDSAGGDNAGTTAGDPARVDTAPDVFGTTLTITENDTAEGQFEAQSSQFTITDQGNNGTVVVDASTGRWSYTPNADYVGTDSFTLLAAGADAQTVTVTVENVDEDSVNVAGTAAQFTNQPYDRLTGDLGTTTFSSPANNVTIEMMVNLTAIGTQQNILDFVGSSNNHVFNLFLSSDLHLELAANDDANTTRADSEVTPVANTWYHVATTYDGTTAKLYIDGDLKAQVAVTLDFNNSSQNVELVIGGNPLATSTFSQGVEFNGKIDEVRVWNDVRTAAEIRDNIDQQLAGSEGNLQAYYRFDDDGTENIKDYSGNNRDLTSLNNQVLSLDGTGDYVDLNGAAALGTGGNAFTYEAWIKTSFTGDYQTILSVGGTAVNNEESFFYVDTGTGKLTYSVRGISGVALSAQSVTDGTWHHVAVTYDGTSTAQLYIDGQTDGSNTVFGATNIAGSAARIGAQSFNAQEEFNGQIDDVRVWNVNRSQAEIQANMHDGVTSSDTGLLAWYTFDDDDVGTLKTIQNIDDSGASLNGTGVDNATVVAANDSPALTGPTLVTSDAPVLGTTATITEGSTATGTMTNSDVQGTATYSAFSASTGSVSINSSSGAWTYTPPENFAGTATFSVRATGATSGVDTEVVTVTVEADSETAIHGGVLQFDGVDDHMVIQADGNLAFSTGDFSVEGWIKLDQVGVNQAVVDTRGSTNLQGYLVGVNSSNQLRIGFSDGVGSTVTQSGGTTLSVDTWYHIAVSFDRSGNATLHTTEVDGTTTATTVSITSESSSIGTNDIYVGGPSPVATTVYKEFKGSIEELRFWNDVRTTTEIADNYNEQISSSSSNLIAKYQFDDGSGHVVQDSTSNDHDATIGSSDGAVSDQHVLVLNGTNQYVSANLGSAAVSTNLTMEAWVKPDAFGVVRIPIDLYGNSGGEVGLQVSDTGNFNAFFAGSNTNVASSFNLTTGQWAHLAVTFDGSTANLYANGSLVATQGGITLTALTGDQLVRIGRNDGDSNSGSSNEFDGTIDEVRIWSTVRSQAEIQQSLHDKVEGTETGLVAQYSFDDDSIGTSGAVDNGQGTSSRDGTLQNSATITEASNDNPISNDQTSSTGPIGDVLDVNDSGARDDVSGSLAQGTISNQVTIESWIKFDRSGVQENPFALKTQDNATNPRFVAYKLASGALGFFANSDTSTGVVVQSIDGVIETGEWYHVATTYDGSNAILYLNGDQVGSVALSGFSLNGATSQQDFAFGTDNGGFAFDGQMDNARIWSSARSVEEIRDGMTQSYDFDTANLEVQYTFDDVSGTTVRDNDGTQNNGTLNGTATIVDSGSGDGPQFLNHLGTALRFDSTDDTVTIAGGSIPTGAAERTIMLWAKTDGDGNYNFVNYGPAGNNPAGEIHFGLNRGSAKGVRLDIDSSVVVFAPETPTADGQWHHYALVLPPASSLGDTTLNLNDIKIYQDGVLLTAMINAVSPTTAINTTATSSSLTLGANFVGDMSEVSVWSTALTTAQINDYMTRSLAGNEIGLAGYWKLDEGSGTSVNDSSTNNDTGTTSGTAWVENAPALQGNSISIAEDTSASGRVSRVSSVQTAMRNCT